MKILLKCRACDETETFRSTDAVLDSEWMGMSALGSVDDDISEHRAYCPEHADRND